MKKLFFGIIAAVIVSSGIFIFAGCEKEETMIPKIEKSSECYAIETYNSYNGESFTPEFYENPFEDYGTKHNILVKEIMNQWNSESINTNDFASIVDFTITKAKELTNTEYIDNDIIAQNMIETFYSDASTSYIESLRYTFFNPQNDISRLS